MKVTKKEVKKICKDSPHGHHEYKQHFGSGYQTITVSGYYCIYCLHKKSR